MNSPYGGPYSVPGLSSHPVYNHAAGLERMIAEWGGVYDLDPLEADRFGGYNVPLFAVQDILELSANLEKQIDDLADKVDAICVHIDMGVLCR